MFLKLKNPVLDAISDQCGTIIDLDNRKATQDEVEFLVEEIVRECMRILIKDHPVDVKLSDAPYYMNVGREMGALNIGKFFGVSL